MQLSIYQLSQWISKIFHPIISLTIFFVYYGLNNGKGIKENSLQFGLVFGIIILPIAFWITWNVKNQRYSNADVSDRNQRKTLYFFIEGMQMVYLLVYYFINQEVDLMVLFILILTIVMQMSNYFVKSSMHTAFNVLVAFLFFSYSPLLGIIWGTITLIVAISRLILKRHTLSEIIWGTLISFVVSFAYLYTQSLLN